MHLDRDQVDRDNLGYRFSHAAENSFSRLAASLAPSKVPSRAVRRGTSNSSHAALHVPPIEPSKSESQERDAGRRMRWQRPRHRRNPRSAWVVP